MNILISQQHEIGYHKSEFNQINLIQIEGIGKFTLIYIKEYMNKLK